MDPFAVLGISRNATDSEVKKAYRNLAKKYHPDNYVSNQYMAELAAEKMKEVNEAYDKIMNERKFKSHKWNGRYTGSNSNYRDVRTFISNGRIQEAEAILNGVPEGSRDAEWYFLKASVFLKQGWMQEAYINFQRACTMDPGNLEYRAAMQQMDRQRSGDFAGYNPVAGTRGGCSSCDICTSLMCADCCCECMGGDFISCC